MNKDKLASIITRLTLCSESKLENFDDWLQKSQFLSLKEFECGKN